MLSFRRSTVDHAYSSALIDQMLPAEIISHIIMYDLSTAIAAREVSTYWRSFVDWSDARLSELVLHQIRQSKKLWKEALANDGFSFGKEAGQTNQTHDPMDNYIEFDSKKNKWRLKEDNLTSKEMIKNVCAAEKRGKHLVLVRPDELLWLSSCVNHFSPNFNHNEFYPFMVLTSGTIYGDPSGVNDWLIRVDKDKDYILILMGPKTVPLPKHHQSPITFILDLQELIDADPHYYPDRMNTPHDIHLYNVQVSEHLAWTLGIFSNSPDMIMQLSTLLLAIGFVSLFAPWLPAWNVYSLVSLLIGIFLWNFKANNMPNQIAVLLWFLAPVIANHVLTTRPSKVIYDAVGNIVWIILGILYVILVEDYLIKDKKLAHHPNRKKATIVIAALFIVASFDWSKISAAVLNLEIFAKIVYSVVLLIGSALYIACARILFDPKLTIPNGFRKTVKDMNILQERPVIIRLGVAILIRVLINYF